MNGEWTPLGGAVELESKGLITAQGLAVFLHEGRPYAVDNRCPHMGFPLSQGSVDKGILTCHWHAWQFDLDSGGCLSPVESDVAVYPVKIEGGKVWVQMKKAEKAETRDRARGRLASALKLASSLEASKAVYRLLSEEEKAGAATADIVRSGADFGLAYQSSFSGGLVTLTAIVRSLQACGEVLDPATRSLALVHGLSALAGESQGSAPRRQRSPLPGSRVGAARMRQWFLEFMENRESFAAERTLRSFAASGADPKAQLDLVFSAATDHLFMGGGHVLDFCNKACELLDLLGWERAPDVLTSLLPLIASGSRHEEDMSWKHPKDLVGLIRDAERQIRPSQMLAGEVEVGDPWDMGEILCDSEPEQALPLLVRDLERGVGLEPLCLALAAASCLRLARFHTRNEFFDWDSVHHLFTYSNALLRAARRSPSPGLARGLFHGYGYLYLTRFLNIPRAKLPEESQVLGEGPDLEARISARDIDGAGREVHRRMGSGGKARDIQAALARAAFKEDHGFHTWQQLEAASSLYALLPDDERRYRPMAAHARWLAAHSPTARSLSQTVENAVRLERGDRLYED